MQLLNRLTILAPALGLTMAFPLLTENIEASLISPSVDATIDPSSRCGYVRLHEGDGYIVGVYSSGTCEPIYRDEEATLYRIDTAGCSCKFFA